MVHLGYFTIPSVMTAVIFPPCPPRLAFAIWGADGKIMSMKIKYSLCVLKPRATCHVR